MSGSPTAAVHTRLEAQRGNLGLAVGRVYRALDLNPLKPTISPSAVVVLPIGDEATASLTSAPSPSVQRVQSTIAVVSVVAATNDPGGSTASDALETLYRAVRAALRGFAPIEGWDGLALHKGRLLALDNDKAWWQDDFITAGYPAIEEE